MIKFEASVRTLPDNVELENMSYKDQLTKLGNRFAMEKYINEIDAEKITYIRSLPLNNLSALTSILPMNAKPNTMSRRSFVCS